MRDMIKMVVVIAVLASLSGGLLAGIRNSTQERIEYQQLVFVKGPAIRTILNKCTNDPITDRFKIKDGDTERSVFVGVLDGKPQVIAFEGAGKGFGGMIGVMVGVNLNDDKLLSIGVTTHSETPGLGSKATEQSFGAKFSGLPVMEIIKVKNDGGQIDALTGATITTRGVCEAVTTAGDIYKRIKPQIQEKIKSMKL
ncbi:MAG: electron transport complex protein RnfG [Candidatus Magnetoglobus multicellularis str. Araruama]|uniref:Ion-translocating oxidoreductase complex subunit G n=1 Tax=Candidatus Magnetoglobus multicellularis str. Araruama TaxID=890399 RepID=A0A1V1PCG2_9BACT|nr:MAG: electron transport complex protein RnfG [Candidatus Magnetoglobus multicellularis str. Araruama]